jgi:crotonobetainyl-CoA:carnitine CoA-transferase CaiB-like acyl-CoA transferase
VETVNSDTIFKDLVVVELASVLAGPAVGMFFAELGAKVIKIENRSSGGDMTRSWKLPSEPKDAFVSAYFSSVNYNKEYLDKNLRIEEDRKVVLELIEKADIVISNFKKGSDKKLGMDYPTLSKDNPGLIYASIEGFRSNPKKVAFDLVLQAEIGFMAMNGYPDQDPAKLPVALIDLLAAHQLKEGILIALLKKCKSGKGSHIRVSLEEAAISSLANQASNFLMEGYIPRPMGSLHPNIAPYGEIFTTKDSKDVVLAIGTDNQFKGLCDILNAQNLITDSRFINNIERVKNRKLLKSLLNPYFEKVDAENLLSTCIANNIPIGEIKNMEEVMENPIAKQMLLEEEIDGVETKRLKTVAFTFLS